MNFMEIAFHKITENSISLKNQFRRFDKITLLRTASNPLLFPMSTVDQ